MNAYQIPADPTAVMGRRVVAYIIDAVISAAIFGVMFFAIADNASFPSSDAAEQACEDAREFGDDPVICINAGEEAWASEGGDSLTIIAISLGAGIANHIILSGTAGGSLGKLAMGLRVVNKNTGRIAGIGPNLVRTLLWIVDGFPYCFPLVGLITGFATKGHRRVGDMAAGTLVVGKANLDRPPVVPGLTAPAMAGAAAYAPPPAGWETSAPSGWDTGSAPPPPPASWGAPVPPPPADPWATPSAPSESTPSADPWAAPGAPVAPAPEPTASYDSPTYSPPEPVSYEPPAPAPEPVSYEPPTVEPEPETATYEPPAPAPEPPAPVPEPPSAEPEPVAAEPVATEPAVAATETPGVGAPMWDAARNAYIQWDPSLNAWMQWDDATQQWRPIS